MSGDPDRLVRLRKPHQHGDEPIICEDQDPVFIETGGDAHRLQAQDHRSTTIAVQGRKPQRKNF